MPRLSNFRRSRFTKSPILPFKKSETTCFETADSSVFCLPVESLYKGYIPGDLNSQMARVAKQFIQQNRGLLNNFGIKVEQAYDGKSVELIFKTSTKIGALPLLSPTTGKPDYGFIIKPRFDWPGLGTMLLQMGWKVIPAPLKLPMLPYSDRKIPPWVLSSIVLFRIKALLEMLERRFEFSESDLPAPRGTVNWQLYATSRIAAAKFLNVPCRYPDLRDDGELKAAIHFTLKKQLSSLETQRTNGIVVLKLIDLCQLFLERVKNIVPKQPTIMAINAWQRSPLRPEVFRDGLQAVEWTVDERGLAGLSDLQGLPWIMSMESFFEAWLETIVEKLTKKIGGITKTGRNRETITPLTWTPPYLGSQKYLLPDLILEREDETIIFDAKYKSHWEDLNRDRWANIDEELREQHRNDLLQVLAYSTNAITKKIICCLVYPCTKQTWASLKSRGRAFHRAAVYAGNRKVDLILTAIPMETSTEEAIEGLAIAINSVN